MVTDRIGMSIAAKNSYTVEYLDDEECVTFITEGKNKFEVIVDKDSWFSYLQGYKWTGIKDSNGRCSCATSIKGITTTIHKIIIKEVYEEFWTYGRVVDHINNKPLDNRTKNLRVVSYQFNSGNVGSKKGEMANIYLSGNKKTYSTSMNINGEKCHASFKELDDAKNYRDNVLIPLKEKELKSLEKKERDIEFERGLLTKLLENEGEEILRVLNKYGIAIEKSLNTRNDNSRAYHKGEEKM